MKIRSLLLGSIAAAGLAGSGYAADLGVVTSLDICDELGLSGLTISSDDTCLAISGLVQMEYSIGDYNDGDTAFDPDADDDGRAITRFDIDGETDPLFVAAGDGALESDTDIDAWLKFIATSNSDFGPAMATIKLLGDSFDGTGDPAVVIDEAWVGIGDTTRLMAGYKSSIFEDGNDEPLNYLGLFNSEKVDAGVGFAAAVETGGAVIQIEHNLGNGLWIKGGIEDLGASASLLTAVGTLLYEGDGVKAHASGAVDANGLWNAHAGFEGTWDPISVVGAVAADGSGWWNVLGSAAATFDMFTLAVSGEATAGGEWGLGGSVKAVVSDGVTLNLGGRFFDDNNGTETAWQVEGGVEAAVTETITLTAAVGAIDGDLSATVFYGKAGLAWKPGGGFTSSIDGQVTSEGGYKATFKAKKEFK